MTDKDLLVLAEKARERAYCPYSGISVGAALLTDDGEIFTGANIENAGYSPTVCAERVAIFTAIHSGKTKFKAIAVSGGKVGKKGTSPFPPCGVCRQVMGEFCGKDFRVIWGNDEKVTVRTLEEILPDGFNKSNL